MSGELLSEPWVCRWAAANSRFVIHLKSAAGRFHHLFGCHLVVAVVAVKKVWTERLEDEWTWTWTWVVWCVVGVEGKFTKEQGEGRVKGEN